MKFIFIIILSLIIVFIYFNYDSLFGKNNIEKYFNKHVSFNDDLNVIYINDKNYYDKEDVIDTDVDNIISNLINLPSTNYNKIEPIYNNNLNLDTDLMFDELSKEIDNKYSSLSNKLENGLYNTIEIPTYPNVLHNSDKHTTSTINPAITPDNVKYQIDPEKTIWENYDNATSNNYKGLSDLSQLKNNDISNDRFNMNDKKNGNYGSTNFDNF